MSKTKKFTYKKVLSIVTISIVTKSDKTCEEKSIRYDKKS